MIRLRARPLVDPHQSAAEGERLTLPSVPERYREYAPVPALRPYAACYWTSTAPACPSPRRVLPDGCIDIVFELWGSGPSEGAIVGTMTRPFLFETKAPICLVAVRFRPGGAVPFLRVPADEITDSQVALAEVWPPDGLAERIGEEIGDEARVRRLEAALLARRTSEVHVDRRVHAAVASLDGGERSVDAVAAAVNLSRQQLARLFRQHVGVGPKRFARVRRLQRLLSRVRGLAHPDWPSVALDVGYYDQAHMITDCRRLTGVTPTELAQL